MIPEITIQLLLMTQHSTYDEISPKMATEIILVFVCIEKKKTSAAFVTSFLAIVFVHKQCFGCDKDQNFPSGD